MIKKLLWVLGVCIALTVLRSVYLEPSMVASSATEASENTPKVQSWSMEDSVDRMTGESNRFTGVWADTKLSGKSVYIAYSDSDHGIYVGGTPVYFAFYDEDVSKQQVRYRVDDGPTGQLTFRVKNNAQQGKGHQLTLLHDPSLGTKENLIREMRGGEVIHLELEPSGSEPQRISFSLAGFDTGYAWVHSE